MDVCLLHHHGEVLVHQQMKAAPEPFLKVIAPYREDLVVSVEGLFTWYWLAALCAHEGIPFGLGHALYLQAIHGGKANNDRSDAQQIALLLRGGMRPQAYVYPTELRATRDLLRRRLYRVRRRAELLAHVPQTNSQYNLPALGKKLAYKANRGGVAARFPDPAVQKSSEVDLTLLGHYDQLLTDLERPSVKTAKQHDAHTLYRLQSVPGIGKILSLVLLDAIQDIHRCPRVQEVVASCRLVKCAKESAGTRDGTSGTKIGKAHLKWAFSATAGLCLRDNPAGQQYLARLETQPGQGQALTVLAHQWAGAVYDMLTRDPVFERATLLHSYRSGVGEPAASRGHHGISLTRGLCSDEPTASANAHAHRGAWPGPCAVAWTPAPALGQTTRGTDGGRGLPLVSLFLSESM